MIGQLYYWLKKKDKDLADGLVAGLAGGLVAGLAWGLAWGLPWELEGGIVWVLAGALVAGLVAGLTWGLAWVLACGLTLGFVWGIINITTTYPQTVPIWLTALLIIIVIEVLFWINPLKPKLKENVLWFTTKRKGEALFETLIILVNANNIRYILTNYKINLQDYIPIILELIGYIGVGITLLAVAVILILGYVYINSIRYKRK